MGRSEELDVSGNEVWSEVKVEFLTAAILVTFTPLTMTPKLGFPAEEMVTFATKQAMSVAGVVEGSTAYKKIEAIL